MTDEYDGFDMDSVGVPRGKGQDPTDAGMQIDAADLSLDSLSVSTDRVVRSDMERMERAITGPIRAGFDGVDINRPALSEAMVHGPDRAFEIRYIEPWHYPAPDGANGFRTERYTWDWFSDDELAELLTAENPLEALERGHE